MLSIYYFFNFMQYLLLLPHFSDEETEALKVEYLDHESSRPVLLPCALLQS